MARGFYWLYAKRWGLAIDMERCVQILDEAKSLPRGKIGVVSLLGIPEGLSASQTETFLRKNGAAPKAQTACGAENC
jgi:hypothetical protein